MPATDQRPTAYCASRRRNVAFSVCVGAATLLWPTIAAPNPLSLASTPGLVFIGNEYGTDYYRGPCLIENAEGVLLDDECTIGLSDVGFLIGGPGDDPRLPQSAFAVYAHLQGEEWLVSWEDNMIVDVRFEGPCLTSSSVRFCIGNSVPAATLVAATPFRAIDHMPEEIEDLEGWWAPERSLCRREFDQYHVGIGRINYGDAGQLFGSGTVKVSSSSGSCEFASLDGADGVFQGRALCNWEGRPVEGAAKLHFFDEKTAHVYLPGSSIRGWRLARCETPRDETCGAISKQLRSQLPTRATATDTKREIAKSKFSWLRRHDLDAWNFAVMRVDQMFSQPLLFERDLERGSVTQACLRAFERRDAEAAKRTKVSGERPIDECRSGQVISSWSSLINSSDPALDESCFGLHLSLTGELDLPYVDNPDPRVVIIYPAYRSSTSFGMDRGDRTNPIEVVFTDPPPVDIFGAHGTVKGVLVARDRIEDAIFTRFSPSALSNTGFGRGREPPNVCDVEALTKDYCHLRSSDPSGKSVEELRERLRGSTILQNNIRFTRLGCPTNVHDEIVAATRVGGAVCESHFGEASR